MKQASRPSEPDAGLSAATPTTAAIGLRLWEREGMAGLACPPNLSLIVQTLGGSLPQWVAPSDTLDERYDAEFIIIHDALSSEGLSRVPLHGLRAFSTKRRVIFSSTSIDAARDGNTELPRADLHIKAKDEDLDLVAEALAAVFSGNLLIGLDWADLLRTAGAVRPYGGIGSAVVIQEAPGKDTVSLLHAALARFNANGFNGGLVLLQLVSQTDESTWNLDGFDATSSHVLDLAGKRDAIITATMNATRSVLVLMAFQLRDNHRFYSGKPAPDETLGS